MNTLLKEASRNELIRKSKNSIPKGDQRFKRRTKSKIPNNVRNFNAIDMNKFFKQDILDIDIEVIGETDTYTVTISTSGVLALLQKELRNGMPLSVILIYKTLLKNIDREDIYVRCNCPDSVYRFQYWQSRNNYITGHPQTIPSDITNPKDALGSACKHVLLVLNNISWLLKCASVIYNYIEYMKQHQESLYQRFIFPAIYGKKYDADIQLSIDTELDTDSDTLDKSNEEGRTRGQFKKGNTQGIRFAKTNEPEQLSFDDLEDNT